MTLPNDAFQDLMRDVLQRGETFRFQALGWSMSPFIKPGDRILISPLNGTVPVVGQVVAFIQPETGKSLVHRIIKRKGNVYLMQGDNMAGLSDGEIPLENILGLVSRIQRNGKCVWVGIKVGGLIVAVLSRSGLITPILSVLRFIAGKK